MKIKKKRRREFSRQTFFCAGVSDVFRNKYAIHVLIKQLRQKHNLKWLRLLMSYHKFPNMGENLQGDLTSKLMEGIGLNDFQKLKCNCNKNTKMNGECIYGDNCRASMVVYKAESKCCGKVYVDNTQQKLKIRMGQHFLETKNLANGNGKISDTFAKHFASHLKEKMEKGDLRKAKTCDVRDLVKMSILWEGNPISCNKSFGKISCQLCMNERIEILKQIKSDK